MGYLHINNLYKDQTILTFKECYALEKIHGTSVHLGLTPEGRIKFFSGGEKHENFIKLFNELELEAKLKEIATAITIYGEAYGGKCQGMKATYGDSLRFIAFDVKIGDSWLNVPDAEDVVKKCGLEFIHYERIQTDLSSIDAQRDADSTQAIRNGLGPGKHREGVVLRPIEEMNKKNGERVIAKHKRDEFMETATPRTVDPGKLAVEADANRIALEWVTEMRLQHILDKCPASGIEDTGKIIAAMWEDVQREAAGEIEITKVVQAKCNARCAQLWKQRLARELIANAS